MQKAKQTVSSFLSKGDRHKTTVHEEIRKPVTEEQVRPHTHENVTTAIDKEVHQDHHHTAIQPIQVKETLPEKHSHNVIPIEHKTFQHGNDRDVQAALEHDMSKFEDKSVTHSTTHSVSTAPAMMSEHIHHHVMNTLNLSSKRKQSLPMWCIRLCSSMRRIMRPQFTMESQPCLSKLWKSLLLIREILESHAATKVKEFDGCPTVDGKNIHSEGINGGQRQDHVSGQVNPVNGPTNSLDSDHVKPHSANRKVVHSGHESGVLTSNATSTTANEPTKNTTGITGQPGQNTDTPMKNGRTSATTAISKPMISTSLDMRDNKPIKTHSHSGSAIDVGSNDSSPKSAGSGGTKSSWLDKLNPLKDADGDGKKGID